MRSLNRVPKDEHPGKPEILEPEGCQTPLHPADTTVAIEDNLTPTIAVNADGIPGELKELSQWVCWRLVPQGDGTKDKKEPINPKTGGRADKPTTRSPGAPSTRPRIIT